MELYELLFSNEGIVNTILVLMAILTLLILVWVNVERRKNEEIVEELEEKEMEVERVRGEVQLENTNLLKHEYEYQIREMEEKYKEKIEELIQEKQQIQDESEIKIRRLMTEKEQLANAPAPKVYEVDAEQQTSENCDDIIDQLQATAEKRLEDQKRQLKLKEQQLEIMKKQVMTESPVFSTIRNLEKSVEQIKLNVLSQADTDSHRIIFGDQHLDLLKSTFAEAKEDLILFCTAVSPRRIETIDDALEQCLARGIKVDLVIGTHHFLNESRIHLIELIHLLKKTEKYKKFRLRSQLKVEQDVLICDQRWAVLTSDHWLGENENETIGVQIQGSSSVISIKNVFLESIQNTGFLSLLTDEIKTIGKRKNNILIKLVNFKREIYINSRFIEQIVQELKLYREKRTNFQLIISERNNGMIDYVGHRPINS